MDEVGMQGIEEGRYDIFISFHGSEKLSIDGLQEGTTTRVLARATFNKIMRMSERRGRIPKIFFDENELPSSLDDLFKAVMQTRGGGVPLVLLTKKYFSRAYCLAELRAFMDLEARAVRGGHVGFKFRFICLEKSVDDILNDPNIKKLVPGLSKTHIHGDIATSGSLPAVADAIAKVVLDAWTGDIRTDPSSLGGTVRESFTDLSFGLNTLDVGNAKAVLGIADHGSNIHRMLQVLEVARRDGIISYDNVEMLNTVITVGQSMNAESQRAAVTAYTRKWCEASGWDWGSNLFMELLGMEKKAREDIAELLNIPAPASQGLEESVLPGSS